MATHQQALLSAEDQQQQQQRQATNQMLLEYQHELQMGEQMQVCPFLLIFELSPKQTHTRAQTNLQKLSCPTHTPFKNQNERKKKKKKLI